MKGKNLLAMAGLGLVALSVRSLFEGATSPSGRERAIGGGGVVSPLPNPALCARADRAEAMERVAALGAGWVRIFAFHEHWANPDSQAHHAVATAEALGLRILAVVAPTAPLTNEEAVETYGQILIRHPGVAAIELTNEYDDAVVKRWQDQNAATAADFIAQGTGIIRMMNPDIEVMVGAQVAPASSFKPLVYEMAVRRVPIGELTYASHLYVDDDTTDKLGAMVAIMDEWSIPHRVAITEVGRLAGPNQGQEIISLIQAAEGVLGHPVLSCIHEVQKSSEGFTITEKALEEIRNFRQGEEP